jgi:hypothetical protein
LLVLGVRNPDLDATFTHRQTGKGYATLPQYSVQIIPQIRHHRFMQCTGVDLEQNAGPALLLENLPGIGRNCRDHPVDLLRDVRRWRTRRGYRRQCGRKDKSDDKPCRPGPLVHGHGVLLFCSTVPATKL